MTCPHKTFDDGFTLQCTLLLLTSFLVFAEAEYQSHSQLMIRETRMQMFQEEDANAKESRCVWRDSG